MPRPNGLPGGVLGDILDAKLLAREQGKNLWRVRMSPPRFKELCREIKDNWTYTDPHYICGVKIEPRVGCIFDVDTTNVPRLESFEWL